MTKSKKIVALLISVVMLAAMSPVARADDWYGSQAGYFTVLTSDGQTLFTIGGAVSIDDEYISQDNKRYRVVQVDNENYTAIARYVEDVVLWADMDKAMLSTVAQQGQKKVALYCTHTSESYVPGDGAEAKPEKGGVLDVANQLTDALKKKGIDATVDDSSHEPHDAGAYRRSRQTAMQLMEEKKPDMLLDIHRDGVPNAQEYDKKIDGQDASRIRLVVGRSNQNMGANEDTAKKLKAVADKKYPGLVKDIYIGKGSYNQDLMPNAMLLEFGTHTMEKDRALESTNFVADVVATYLGVSGTDNNSGKGTAGSTAAPNNAQGNQQNQNPSATGDPNAQQVRNQNASANKTAGMSIGWIVGVVAGLGLLFLLVAINRSRKERLGNFFKELTGMGHKRDK